MCWKESLVASDRLERIRYLFLNTVLNDGADAMTGNNVLRSVRQLNGRASELIHRAVSEAQSLRISVSATEHATLLDFGVKAEGGLEAGMLLARICMSDLASVSLEAADDSLAAVPRLMVRTDHPVEACLMSQYAGWKIAVDDFFAMGSGPMRAAARREPLFDEMPESPAENSAVGVLESGKMPGDAVIDMIRQAVGSDRRLFIAVAATASQAGNVQVVARSVETALHKLHELRFPLTAVVSGTGCAPLPPVGKNDLHGIGRTNDAILYGGTVNLWVRCEDSLIETIGPRVPSSASEAHGESFLALFKAANYDFYALDPALFSPAVVIFHNMTTGKSFRFGHVLPKLLRESFGFTS